MKTALILIDIQKGFDDLSYWGNRNNIHAEAQAGKLLTEWRKAKLPVFHIKHNSTNPKSRLVAGQPGNDIQDVVKPLKGEPVISKNVNSAFIGTDLQKRLQDEKIDTVVMAGITTDHCVSTSARMAANLGFTTYVASDATAAFDRKTPDGKLVPAQQVHDIHLASLHGEFAEVLSSDQILKKFCNV